jgi:selenium donor protein
VDDPYTFGQIAVTNALSDIYAMGGRPLTALNIVCFPIRKMDVKILREILRGGLDKMREAGVLLIGGHSVEDDEPKYGLSVTGVVHPEKVLFNRGAKPGDRLILTKPLGTGIVSTALKGGEADPELVARAVACMTTLNRKAAELMTETAGVHACTDVTGFGFLGHALEMIEGSETGMRIRAAAVPFFPGIRPLVEEINERFGALAPLSDDELRAKTEEFRGRLASEEATLDDLLPEAYAVVKEACRRHVRQSWQVCGQEIVWDMVPYDVQLIGGIVLLGVAPASVLDLLSASLSGLSAPLP